MLGRFVSRYRFLPDELMAIKMRVPIFAVLFATFMGCMISSTRELHSVGSGVTFTPVEGITQSGLFAYSRNPIYIAILILLPSFAVLFDSAWPLISVAPMFVFLSKYIIPVEEAFLAQHFGAAYDKYAEAVPRWLAA